MKIVYIHGASATGDSFNYIRQHLKHKDEYIIEYDSKHGFHNNLESMKEQLKDFNDMFFVCHSLGGIYALHLSESKKELRHKELLALFQNEAYTSTQKKVLKQFDATKKLYQLGLLKAGEVKENDKQLEAALCLVDLKYEEANDAPQIVALVANNEIDLALKRIESFGGTDKEGEQRKFILYMLCLMELTFEETKNEKIRRSN